MKKFLIINPFGVGDVLFTTPVIASLKDKYPDSIIGYWCNERVNDIFKDDPRIDKIFALNRGDLKRIYGNSKLEGIKRFLTLLFSIAKEKFDVALDFSLDHRYSLLTKLLGIKRRIGFNYKNRGRFLTDKIDIDGYEDKHVVEYYLDLLKFINIQKKSKNLYLFVPQKNKIRSELILKEAGISDKDLLVGIAAGAGASWGKDALIKHWPAVKFAQLADKLIVQLGAKVLLLGDRSERNIADTIVNSMKNEAIDLVGRTSLAELIAIINDLAILITNDGGPLHIAAALGKKTVSFFGPVDPAVYGPYPPDNNFHIVLKKDLACSPCYRNFRLAECLNDRECLGTIEVDEAMAAVRSVYDAGQ